MIYKKGAPKAHLFCICIFRVTQAKLKIEQRLVACACGGHKDTQFSSRTKSSLKKKCSALALPRHCAIATCYNGWWLAHVADIKVLSLVQEPKVH
jgi:hypothetical protein